MSFTRQKIRFIKPLALFCIVVLFCNCQKFPHLENIKKLTEEGDNGEAYFSRDGKKLIWQSNRGGYACDKIWIMNIDGSNVKRLTFNSGYDAEGEGIFSDGKKIVFTSKREGDLYLYIMNKDGSDLYRITHNDVFDSFPMFSPDGKKLVFASNRQSGDPHQTNIFIANWVE